MPAPIDSPIDLRLMPPYGGRRSWLVAPERWSRVKPDALAPEFAVAPADLAAAWRRVLAHQPRVRVLAGAEEGLRVEAEQRTRLFRFRDLITAEFFPAGPGRATLAVFSRSLVGHWDLGVNRRRLTAWLAALEREVAGARP